MSQIHRQMSHRRYGWRERRGQDWEFFASHPSLMQTTWRTKRYGWPARIQRINSGIHAPYAQGRRRDTNLLETPSGTLRNFWDRSSHSLTLTYLRSVASKLAVCPSSFISPRPPTPHTHTIGSWGVKTGAGVKNVEKRKKGIAQLNIQDCAKPNGSRGEFCFCSAVNCH